MAGEVARLTSALRELLGTADTEVGPAPDPAWREGWRALAAVGVAARCVHEERGGLAVRTDTAVAAASELGAALHGSPFAGVMASAHALAAAQEPVAEDLLEAILAGERICAFGRLDGRSTARVVDGAPAADALLLADDDAGDCLLFTDGSWSVDATRHSFDVTRSCGDVTVDPAAGRSISGSPGAGHLYRLLLAADAVGCLQRMLDLTTAFAGQRHAFGRPIGGFQSVQHPLADHAVRAHGMSLALNEAARLLGAGARSAPRAIAIAEVSVSSGATHILHHLLHFTGAIGFTWDYGLHFAERRVHQDARLAANPRAAVRSLAEIEGWASDR